MTQFFFIRIFNTLSKFAIGESLTIHRNSLTWNLSNEFHTKYGGSIESIVPQNKFGVSSPYEWNIFLNFNANYIKIFISQSAYEIVDSFRNVNLWINFLLTLSIRKIGNSLSNPKRNRVARVCQFYRWKYLNSKEKMWNFA